MCPLSAQSHRIFSLYPKVILHCLPPGLVTLWLKSFWLNYSKNKMPLSCGCWKVEKSWGRRSVGPRLSGKVESKRRCLVSLRIFAFSPLKLGQGASPRCAVRSSETARSPWAPRPGLWGYLEVGLSQQLRLLSCRADTMPGIQSFGRIWPTHLPDPFSAHKMRHDHADREPGCSPAHGS